MNSQPEQPFQAPREILRARLAALVQGAVGQPEHMALVYRVSGGPPGKRLLIVLRLSVTGELTYEHSDELKPREAMKARTKLPREEALAVFRQVQESGLLDNPDTGKGFLPDSVIGSVILESAEAKIAYHFLADEKQQQNQGKEPPPAIRALLPVLDRLGELARKESRAREAKQYP